MEDRDTLSYTIDTMSADALVTQGTRAYADTVVIYFSSSNVLTRWGRDKVVAIFQTTSLNAFFFNENVWISIKISLKFVPNGPINNILGFVQIMAWRRPGVKPLSEPMMFSLLKHICVTQPQWVNTRGFILFYFQSKYKLVQV